MKIFSIDIIHEQLPSITLTTHKSKQEQHTQQKLEQCNSDAKIYLQVSRMMIMIMMMMMMTDQAVQHGTVSMATWSGHDKSLAASTNRKSAFLIIAASHGEAMGFFCCLFFLFVFWWPEEELPNLNIKLGVNTVAEISSHFLFGCFAPISIGCNKQTVWSWLESFATWMCLKFQLNPEWHSRLLGWHGGGNLCQPWSVTLLLFFGTY